MSNNLGGLGKLLDEIPNMNVGIGAIIAELGRQPRNAKKFFINYQDRILFGKDSWVPQEFPTYFRVLESADEYFPYHKKYHAFWPMYGLDLPDVVLKLDRLIDSTPLEDWETTAWTSVLEETQGSNFRNKSSRWHIPGVERTNDFVCAVFSCFNDPRAPPSTDMMLSLKLLSEGVNMGLRGDPRISAEGLILSLDDVLEKVNAYVNLVDRSLTP